MENQHEARHDGNKAGHETSMFLNPFSRKEVKEEAKNSWVGQTTNRYSNKIVGGDAKNSQTDNGEKEDKSRQKGDYHFTDSLLVLPLFFCWAFILGLLFISLFTCFC